jgi:hypothetical protein
MLTSRIHGDPRCCRCHRLVQFSLASIVRFSMPDRFKPPHNPSLKDYGCALYPFAKTTSFERLNVSLSLGRE